MVVGPCEPLLEDLGLADPFWKIAAAEIMTKKANKHAKQCGKKMEKAKIWEEKITISGKQTRWILPNNILSLEVWGNTGGELDD